MEPGQIAARSSRGATGAEAQLPARPRWQYHTGIAPGNHCCWKDSVGPLIERTPNYSMWGTVIPDSGYSQSLHIGFYENFLRAEDLGAEPLPDMWAGLQVQIPGGSANVVERYQAPIS